MLSQLAAHRLALAVVLTVALAASACIEDPFVTLPETANKDRNRSVVVDASKCVLRNGSSVACPAQPTSLADGIQVAGLRGVNGVPVAAVDLDNVETIKTSFGNLHAYWTRLPVGYGCAATLQGIFPDAAKDATKLESYDFSAFQPLLAAARNANTVPLWTAAYGLGDGTGKCAYENGEQKGTPIPNEDTAKKWAKVVRFIAKYYDRDLVVKNAESAACKVPAGTVRPWDCTPSIFNIEYGRDPFGAGGFTDATKAVWLKGYREFARELREEFPLPGNDVNLVGPSVVIKGELPVQNPAPSNKSRSPIFDFIDDLVDPAKGPRPSLSFLTIEVEAATPVEAQKIVAAVSKYATEKKLLRDDSLRECFDKPVACPAGQACGANRRCALANPATCASDQQCAKDEVCNKDEKKCRLMAPALCSDAVVPCYAGENCAAEHKCRNNGQVTVPIWVTDLRLSPSKKLPDFIANDPARKSAYLGGFYASTKTLWQGLVAESITGNAVRFPTVEKSSASKEDIAKTARDSDLLWFGPSPPPAGSLKPAAWQSFWFNDGFLAHKQKVSVEHGPDPLKTSGIDATGNNPADGLIILATRETCTDELGTPIDCINDSKTPVVTEGRKRLVRVLVSDLALGSSTGGDILEHQLRIQVDNIPTDVKTVGYRWAYMDGGALTWTGFVFPEQGLLDTTKGSFHLTRTVAVPSLHYVEFLY